MGQVLHGSARWRFRIPRAQVFLYAGAPMEYVCRILLLVGLAIPSLVFGSSVSYARDDLGVRGLLVHVPRLYSVEQTLLDGQTEPETREVFKIGNGYIESLSKIDNDRFLFDKRGNPSKIMLFNRKTGEITPVTEGFSPAYVPSLGMIFFYRAIQMELKLFVADFDDIERSARVVHGGPISLAHQVIEVDDSRVVMSASDVESSPVMIFDARNSKLSALPIIGCRPMLWRSLTNQLICYDKKREKIVMKSLGGATEDFPDNFEQNMAPVLYIAENDVILFTFEHGHYGGVALYSFSGKYQLLLRGVRLGRGGALIFPLP